MREGASIDLNARIQAARLACWKHLWVPKFKPRSCTCWKKPHVPSRGCVCHLTKVPFFPTNLGPTAAPYTAKVSPEGPAWPEAAAVTQLGLQGWVLRGFGSGRVGSHGFMAVPAAQGVKSSIHR